MLVDGISILEHSFVNQRDFIHIPSILKNQRSIISRFRYTQFDTRAQLCIEFYEAPKAKVPLQ